MYKKILIAGGTAAVIIGLGTAAFAESGSTTGTPTPTGTTSSTAKAAAGKGDGALGKLAKRAISAQIVTRGKDGSFVTHDLERGTVTSVSPTSIVVKAADNTSETFAVTSATKVRVRTTGTAKGAAGTIAQVATGKDVLVLGTGTSPMTATDIVVLAK
jgi:hypothetical protein